MIIQASGLFKENSVKKTETEADSPPSESSDFNIWGEKMGKAEPEKKVEEEKNKPVGKGPSSSSEGR